jgi:hypothetical protein
VRSAPFRLSRRREKPEVSARDRPHRAFGVHLSPRDVRQAAVRPSKPLPGVQVSRPVGRRETPPTGRRKSNRLSLKGVGLGTRRLRVRRISGTFRCAWIPALATPQGRSPG